MTIIYLYYSSKYNNFKTETAYIIKGVNTIGQIKFILLNPLKFLMVLFNSIMCYGELYIKMLAGGSLAWGDLDISSGVYFLWFILFVLSPFLVREAYYLPKRHNNAMILFSIFIFLLTLIGIYLCWNPVGSSIINGFQGRYLIPLLLPFIISFSNKKSYVSNKPIYIYILLMIINVITLYQIYCSYI